MAHLGLGNFLYELTVKDGASSFHFFDPEDASNTADVTVNVKDFPEGINQPDSRQVADLAFSQCSKVLNDKRDARLRKEADKQFKDSKDEEARQREASSEFLNTAEDVAVKPAKVEDDGTHVYNTSEVEASDKSDKK